MIEDGFLRCTPRKRRIQKRSDNQRGCVQFFSGRAANTQHDQAENKKGEGVFEGAGHDIYSQDKLAIYPTLFYIKVEEYLSWGGLPIRLTVKAGAWPGSWEQT